MRLIALVCRRQANQVKARCTSVSGALRQILEVIRLV
jgi:hypothetical protein